MWLLISDQKQWDVWVEGRREHGESQGNPITRAAVNSAVEKRPEFPFFIGGETAFVEFLSCQMVEDGFALIHPFGTLKVYLELIEKTDLAQPIWYNDDSGFYGGKGWYFGGGMAHSIPNKGAFDIPEEAMEAGFKWVKEQENNNESD